MRLDEVVAWYQKKIGTYDKQLWEKTVEQRILNGFTSIPLKNTTLKTELIDVDLVRGSSFPKAKPKQTLLTVLRLAVLRFLFLPVYAKWWVEQTSPTVFTFLLIVYLVQMFNWGVYSINVNRLGPDAEHIVSISELLIPVALSLILSVIHSQIVATASNISKSEKRRQPHQQPKHKRKRERVKRRKKNTRLRSTTSDATRSSSNLDTPIVEKSKLCHRNLNMTLNQPTTILLNTKMPSSQKQTGAIIKDSQLELRMNQCDIKNDLNTISKKNEHETLIPSKLTLNTSIDTCAPNPIELMIVEPTATNLRKRNVNWDSPIKSQVMVSLFDHHNDYFDESENRDDSVTANTPHSSPSPSTESSAATSPDDQPIERIVEEYFNEVLDMVVDDQAAAPLQQQNLLHHRSPNTSEQTGDDDGFESLNGKSSSGEENLNDRELAAGNLDSLNLMSPMKMAYRNTWVRDFMESGAQNKISDSDTDTLKGTSTLMVSRKSSLSVPQSSLNLKPLSTKHNSLKVPKPTISSESELDFMRKQKISAQNLLKMQKNFGAAKGTTAKDVDSSDIDEDNEDCETMSTPGTNSNPHLTEGTTSATEWIGVTTNSDECSYSSDLHHSDSQNECSENGLDHDFTSNVILNPSCGASDRISCTIWDHNDAKKAEMSVLDISSAIIEKVEAMPETCDYIYIGVVFSILLSLIPAFCRLCEATLDTTNSTEMNFFEMPVLLLEKASFSCTRILMFAFGESGWEKIVLTVSLFLRLCLTFLFFFLLAVAERTFKQRFLYAKLFSHLTSSRRARKSDLPHFRLNKVRNIKTWLSVRSYLKRRGPQRSVDVIVSAAFLLTLLLLAFLSVEWLKDSVHLHSQLILEALLWSCSLGIFLSRFMTLGNEINRKYRSISVLITEQINLYLQIEQKPHKKEELMVSNSVLKLAADLLKELESPFKISGLSANPYLYTTVKVVILSALSGVLSEILGFKLKLHKIKIK